MPSMFEHFTVLWLKSAHKNFEKLSKSDQKIITKQIELLSTSYENSDIKKLKGYDNLYRLRAKDYRIIFTVNKNLKQISISAVGHRREIYNLIGH
jgi:mRNA interferase RelE/StbE